MVVVFGDVYIELMSAFQTLYSFIEGPNVLVYKDIY